MTHEERMEAPGLSVEERLLRLRPIIRRLGRTLVAFSGGVDSSFLLAVAVEVLRDQVIALMTISPSTPPEDIEHADSLARSLGVQLLTISHNELAIPQYAANPTNRCYFCKSSLYDICKQEASRLSIQSIVDGINLDDLSDYRPGLHAAKEHGILHPLVDAQFDKRAIRSASKRIGLLTWEKPASPCLSSRIPYGTAITAIMLRQIASGESLLRSLGVREVRVRHHGASARIEVATRELFKLCTPTLLRTVQLELKRVGYSSILLDLEGYRSGVFNSDIQEEKSQITVIS